MVYKPRPVSCNQSFCWFVSFLFLLCRGVLCSFIATSTFFFSTEFNSDSFGIRTMIIKENYNVPTLVGEIQKIHRQEPVLRPPVDFIYIASLLNRHGISCNPCHAVKARHCLVCHAAPRVMVPDPLGCGSVRVKRRNTPCLGDCQENTTLSGGGQPPPSAQVYKACWDYVACDRFAMLLR